MNQPLRFVPIIHNHQPVGNFDGVIEQAYQDSYLPFLDVLQDYPKIHIGLHTSGSLIQWLDVHHPEYLDRLAEFVSRGQIEIVGGAFYEPILTMLPSRDRVGQITSYNNWLQQRLGAVVRGLWIPERVWEPSLVSDLVTAGNEYTVLDDFHFKAAGLTEDELHGYYLTEDDGQLLRVFPGSERLRYTIPFHSPQESIDYLGQINYKHSGAVITFADDGEKFGTWPDTKKHVYENGWLRQFFDALCGCQDWLTICTPSEALDSQPAVGKIYLPDCSYREMTEWALPATALSDYEQLTHEMQDDPRWSRIASRLRGGSWRNFKVKYLETDEMYARMMLVSQRLQQAKDDGFEGELLEAAKTELYKGQCNCSYWHGAFGGVYLPHLRGAIYQCLIAADNLLDQLIVEDKHWVDAIAADLNLDARQEVLLSGDQLNVYLAPTVGGQIYELDVRSICHNLLATLTRRPEAYHRKILANSNGQNEGGSIHERVVFKQEGLDSHLQYDAYPRKSLLDHFYSTDATLQSVQQGEAAELGNFLSANYETKIRRNPDRVQVQMQAEGSVEDLTIKITKGVTLQSGSNTLEIAYLLEGLPPERTLHFAVEMNFAGMPAGADDRYFYDAEGVQLGQLGTQLDLQEVTKLGLIDQWLGLDVSLLCNRPTNLWTHPIAAVSQSESGFELVHQSVVVYPHWFVQADENGRWAVQMRLEIDTSIAQSRMKKEASAATV